MATGIIAGMVIAVLIVAAGAVLFLKNNPKKRQALKDKAIEEIKEKLSGV